MTNLRIAVIGVSALVVGMLTASCSKNTPITPSSCTDFSLSSLVLSPSSVAVGTSVQGTVSLACPASSGGASVTVSSSNASATVPASVAVASGSSSATFTVTTVSAGTPTISASSGGATRTAPLTITGTTTSVSLANMSLASSSVVGGNAVTGTVTLSAAAPSGGTVVSLSSSDASVGTVPGSVTVPAGSTTATFSVSTRAVGGTINIVITAALSGVTKPASLAVTQAPVTLAAAFTVASLVNSAANTCQLSSDGSSLSCRFDAGTSTSPNGFKEYRWTWQLPTRSVSSTVTSSRLDNPSTNGCGLFTDLSSAVKASGNPISMTVRLVVVDTTGSVSVEVANANVQILPTKNACGFNF